MSYAEDWDAIECSCPARTFTDGYRRGFELTKFVTNNRPGENGYTLRVYTFWRDIYFSCIYAFYPTAFQIGFGLGCDHVATPVEGRDQQYFELHYERLSGIRHD